MIATSTIWPVGYVIVASHTSATPPSELVGTAPGWFPDPLGDFPLNLPAGETHSLWISIYIPEDATPGLYHGSIEVKAGEGKLVERKLLLQVVRARVPKERSLKVTNWFTLNDKVTQQFYGVSAYSDEWWLLLQNVAQVLGDHRQNMVLTPLLELIQGRSEGGSIQYDFSRFDRWVTIFRNAGIPIIEGSHLLGRAGGYHAAMAVETLQMKDGKVEKVSLPPEDPRVDSFVQGFLSALDQHLAQNNWKDVYLQHVLDEPHGNEPPQYERIARLVHRYLPGIKTIDAVDAAHITDEVKRNCDIWVPILGRFDQQMDTIQNRIQDGKEVWFYTCLFPNGKYMNRLMDYPLLKVELLHWLNFRYGLTGFLHWGLNHWTPDPIKATQPIINENTTLLPAGDAFLVYPDRKRKSIQSSIRFEIMREGIEDYELLSKLKTENPALAAQIVREAVDSTSSYVREVTTFRRIRKKLLAAFSPE